MRGQPLVLLAVVISGWVSARAVVWETPFPEAQMDWGTAPLAGQSAANLPKPAGPVVRIDLDTARAVESFPTASDLPIRLAEPAHTKARASGRRMVSVAADSGQAASGGASTLLSVVQPLSNLGEDLQSTASHQLLWMAAMAHLPVPTAITSALKAASGSNTNDLPALPKSPRPDRWSLDAWAFWRQGSGSSLAASGQLPSYGASQAGAILRYELAPSGTVRPRAYVRGYSSLVGNTEQELAAGLSAKPIKSVPLRVHAEGRALQSGGRTNARAAAFVTTEIPPVRLPAGFAAELYGQAGYVGGRSATPFADGQLHVMRTAASFDLARANDTRFKIGAAAFAGAQKGARRVDIGPSMRIETRIADTPARLSVDWRQRIAGDAEPGSGLAVTLSTRF
jgi:hypothetical protein